MGEVAQLTYLTEADVRGVDLRGAEAAPHPAGIVGGLVLIDPRTPVRILTGVVMGPVRITVDRLSAPPTDLADGWEDVVEVSCNAVEDAVVVAGPNDYDPDPRFALNPPGAQWFRLRVHARNRDMEFDLVATGPHEQYLLVTWPAPPAAPAVLAATSGVAQRSMAARRATPELDAERARRAQEIIQGRADRWPGR